MRDYSTVTETPGERISREAAAMLYSRYRFTRSLASGRRLLEVACGSGQGLGFIRGAAAFVVGADITAPLLREAARTYGGTIPLVQLDAEQLPFRAASFDVIVLHEALYYLPDAERFVSEASRVLSAEGLLLIVSVNPEWSDFNRSPFATRYFRAEQLHNLLHSRFESVETSFGFPAAATSFRARLISIVKRAAVRARLIPRTMRGKRLLKRLFLGSLQPVPRQLVESPDAAFEAPRALVGAEAPGDFKVIYAVGRKPRRS